MYYLFNNAFNKYIIFGCTMQHGGSSFPNQGSNPCPLQWKHRVLTTPSGLKVPNHFKMLKSFLGHTQHAVGRIWPASHGLPPLTVESWHRDKKWTRWRSLSLASHILGMGRPVIMNNQFSILKSDVGKGDPEHCGLCSAGRWQERTLKSCAVVWLSLCSVLPGRSQKCSTGYRCPCMWGSPCLYPYQSSQVPMTGYTC